MYAHISPNFPPVTRDPRAIESLRPGVIGADVEWSIRNEEITIIGLSDGYTHISVPVEEGLNPLREFAERHPETIWVGHNFVSADLFAFENVGIKIPLRNVEDTILHHYLNNMNLCKATKLEEGEGDKRGRGFMNLWTMCSIYTDYPNWKNCREEECEGPCDRHNPFHYNAMDSFIPLTALPKMMQQERLRGTAHLYPLHREFMYVMGLWNRRGVLTSRKYVQKLRDDFRREKFKLWDPERAERKEGQIEGSLPFNPRSPKAVKDFFAARKIKLEDTEEQTIRDLIESYPEDHELQQLLDYKEIGNGSDRWYAPCVWNDKAKEWEGFVDENDLIHPRFGPFTSSGRTNCVDPNLQNVSKRRVDRKTKENIGKKVRRAIIAPEGYLLYRADFSNAENRSMLHHAGTRDIPDTDFHSWTASLMNIPPDHPFALSLGSVRDAAKSVSHASNYGEGIQLLEKGKLTNPRIMKEVSCGARVIFEDWKVFGKIVSFTGINLAERAFGAATFENRKKALDIQLAYFKGFPQIRELQKKICFQLERESAVIVPHGYYISSYGMELDRIKTALAIWGSNPVAHLMKIACINAENHPRLLPKMTIHDELVIASDACYKPTDVAKWIKECMVFETPEMSGFSLPIDCNYSPFDKTREVPESNWADLKNILE